MNEQIGWRGFVAALKAEAPRYAHIVPELPRLIHQSLSRGGGAPREAILLEMLAEQKRTNRTLQGVVWALAGFVAGVVGIHLWQLLRELQGY